LNNIFVVCVFFEPDLKKIDDLFQSLKSQVSYFVIINNGSYIDFDLPYDKSHLINLNANFGIAFAQNIGIRYSLDKGADFIITTDQDSRYPVDYVETMYNLYSEYNTQYNIACLAPSYSNFVINDSVLPYVYFDNFLLKSSRAFIGDIAFPSHVISSGMFIPVNVFYEVGFMNEDLFIDWVDTEWCWRALDKNYKIIQTNRITLSHYLGNATIVFLNYKFSSHRINRYYYSFRNSIYLFLYSNNISIKYRYFLFTKIFKIFIFSLYVSFNLSTLRILLIALFHASIKRMGKY